MAPHARNRVLPRLLVLAITVTLSAPAPAEAASFRRGSSFGLGLGAGTMANGLSLKYFSTSTLAFQGTFGTFGGGGAKGRFGNPKGAAAGLDVLLEMMPLAHAKIVDIAWNAGAGVGVGVNDFEDRVAVAGTFVLGLEIAFIPIPLDFVIEYRPSLLIVPDIDLDFIDFGGHIRWYF